MMRQKISFGRPERSLFSSICLRSHIRRLSLSKALVRTAHLSAAVGGLSHAARLNATLSAVLDNLVLDRARPFSDSAHEHIQIMTNALNHFVSRGDCERPSLNQQKEEILYCCAIQAAL